jgi:hypothetical protein
LCTVCINGHIINTEAYPIVQEKCSACNGKGRVGEKYENIEVVNMATMNFSDENDFAVRLGR